MTWYQLHSVEWKDCERCCLCSSRKQVVLGRGVVPCDILFIGEAPGESEDVIGEPFVGPAGKLLDQIIRQALRRWPNLTYAMTNLVGCIPRDANGDKVGEPEMESIEACAPRLQDFTEIAHPRLIVCVGALARDWIKPGFAKSTILPSKAPSIDIIHPAAILRANVAQKGLLIQRAVVTLTNAVEDYLL